MQLAGSVINFLGDSITEGHGASAPEMGYVHQLAVRFGLKEARNYGIGGTRYARQRTPSPSPRHDLDFCRRAVEMDPTADAVVVFGGTNDFGHGDAPFGTFADRTPDTFYGACHTLYTTLLTRYPTVPVVVLTPTHRLEERVSERGDKGGLTLADYVKAEREVAEYYSLPLLDLYACGGMQPQVPAIRAAYMPDGLHPNDAGHALLAERVGRFLQSL